MSQTYPLIDVFSYRNESFMSSFFHTHSEYEILYVHAGQCRYLLGETILDLTAGDMIVMNGIQLEWTRRYRIQPAKGLVHRSAAHYL